jgi:hypothetical protein
MGPARTVTVTLPVLTPAQLRRRIKLSKASKRRVAQVLAEIGYPIKSR